MDETRMTARLPHLDIEIVRRLSEDGAAEMVTMHLTAVPNFESVAKMMAPQALLLPFMAANPFLAVWARMIDQAWSPWMALTPPERTGD